MKAAVLSEIKRPDQTALISSAVNAMVLKAHSVDFFPRDLVESNVITVGTPGTEVSEALPTRWRKFNYIFQTGSTGLILAGHKGFENVDAADRFQWDTSAKNEIYYVAGSNVKLKNFKTSISYIKYGYFEYPDVSNDALNTWMTSNVMLERAILDMAIRYIHLKLGDATRARSEELNWVEWKATILAEALISSV